MRYVYLFIGITLLYACNNKVLSKKQPFDIIEIEAENTSLSDYWKIKDHHTGISIRSTSNYQKNDKYFSTEVNIKTTGNYHLWLLTALGEYKPAENATIKVTLANQSKLIKLSPLRAPNWRHDADGAHFLVFQSIPKGKYAIKFEDVSDGNNTILIDRMILTNNPNFMPSGYGYQKPAEIILPPQWAFGLIYGGYTNQIETEKLINNLKDQDYPIDAYWIDSWFWNYQNQGKGPKGYLDFVGDTIAYPNKKAMWDMMKKNHIKSGIWVWNAIIQEGNEPVFDEFLKKGYFAGTPFVNRDSWHNSTKRSLTGNIDFSNPEVVLAWKNKLKPMMDMGVDFFKLDRNSDVDYLKACFELTQEYGNETKGRGYIMSHLHSTSEPLAKLYPAKWTGDAKIAWNQPDFPNTINYAMGAFKENIMMVADPLLGTYEYPFLANDTGGYDFFGSEEQSDELYIRWVQFSMFNPITNIFSTHKNKKANLPYNFNADAQAVFKKYSQMKMQLFPYIYTHAHMTRQSGKKMIQGYVHHPLQYMFGDAFLVAPIYEKGSIQRDVYFDKGYWFDYFNHQLMSGDTNCTIKADLLSLPLFVKDGSIVPFRDYASSIEEGNNDKLLFKVYIHKKEKSAFMLIEDDGISNDYLSGKVAKTEYSYTLNNKEITISIGKTLGYFEGMKSDRNHSFEIIGLTKPPKKITSSNGRTISFDFDGAVLSFEIGKIDKNSVHEINIQL